jgi:hypothetical protein
MTRVWQGARPEVKVERKSDYPETEIISGFHGGREGDS